jgi:glycosyltransferase involved in cell wall biosynthesis
MQLNNTSNPVVTIVITTFRRPKLLKRAIKSVLRQTYPYFEIRVYDDASGDETEEVVSEFSKVDPRIHFHSHEKNLGNFIDNINFGISRVTTPLWTVLSDDNLFLPNFLKIAVQDFEKHPQAIFCAQQVILMQDDGGIHTVCPSNAWRPGFYKPLEGLHACIKDPSFFGGAIYRYKAIEEIGLMDRDTNEVSDWDYIFRSVCRFPFFINLQPGVIFRFNIATSLSGKTQGRYTWSHWHKMLNNMTSYSTNSTIIKSAEIQLKKRLRRMLIEQGKTSARTGNFEDSILSANTLKKFFRSYNYFLYLLFLNILLRNIPRLRKFFLLSQVKSSEEKQEKRNQNYSHYMKYKKYL